MNNHNLFLTKSEWTLLIIMEALRNFFFFEKDTLLFESGAYAKKGR